MAATAAPRYPPVNWTGEEGAADVDERRQILVGAAERVRNPTAEGRMIECAAAMAGLGFDHGRKMIAFVAPHRAHDRDVVDHAADVGKPIGDRNARLAVVREGAQAGMTGRFIVGELSPKPMASMNLPACLLSLGSKVSMWLTPPHMKRKMTDFGLRCSRADGR